ncbi:hypothetical protein HNQ57_003304 [Zhongshania antarctica]|uniref:Uncharacterized protein n=1 Tax=Zhongshania antarctica TaxID=641702 RepID=A0A840R6Y0_9GAMM|nr:hypothetical protein [Zhongshania antarctica]
MLEKYADFPGLHLDLSELQRLSFLTLSRVGVVCTKCHGEWPSSDSDTTVHRGGLVSHGVAKIP